MCLAAIGAAPRPAALDALDRLVGTWQSSGTFVNSAYSNPRTVTATTTCAWSNDRVFLICQQSALADGKAVEAVAIYTYDDAKQKYHFYTVQPGRADSTQLAVSPTTIEYDDSFTDGSKKVLTRTLNVWETPRRYTWRAEYSLDGGITWTLMGSGLSLLAVDG
jgi:hypothetical protein